MSISRRMFLRAGTLFVVAAGVPATGLAQQALNGNLRSGFLPGLPEANSDSHLNKETFARYLNTVFLMRYRNSRATALTLIELHDEPTAKQPVVIKTESFSALFVGPANAPLRQNTYAIQHAAMGKFDLLLVPMGKNKQGMIYEAVFNRLA